MIEIKDNNEVLVLSTPIGVGSKRKFELMKDDYITLKFSLLNPISFKMGCYAECDFGRFEIIEDQKPSFNNSTGGYDYELKMEASYMKWKNKVFKYTPETGGNEAAWDLTAQLSYHLDIFLRNLKVWGFQYGGEDYEYEIDNDVNVDALVMHYSNTNLIDALTSLAEAANCEWWMEGKKIRFGRCEKGEAVEISLGEEAETMSLSKSSGDYFTRIYAFGSTQNISSRYRKKLEFKVDKVSGNIIKDSIRRATPDMFMDKLVTYDEWDKKMSASGSMSMYGGEDNPNHMKGEVWTNPFEPEYKDVPYSIDMTGLSGTGGNISFDFSNYTGIQFNITLKFVSGDVSDFVELYRSESQFISERNNSTYKAELEKSFRGSLQSSVPNGKIWLVLCLEAYKSPTSEQKFLIPYTVEGNIKGISEYGKVDTTLSVIEGEDHSVTINPQYYPYDNDKASDISISSPINIGEKFTLSGIVKLRVPLGYFDSDVDGLTVNGVVQRRLMLPEGTPYIDVYPDMSPDEVIEGIVTFDYIYPRKVLSISSVEEEMIDVTEGEEKKPTGMKVPVYTIKTTGLVGFDKSYVISEELTVTFKTGRLAGLTFGLTFLPEKSDDTSTCFEIVANEDYGGRLPDTVMKPSDGSDSTEADTFVMAGYDTEYVFENLVPEAEEELKAETEKCAEKIRNNIGTVSAKLMSDWSKARNETQDTPCPFGVGQKVRVNNPSFFPSPRTMRVLGYELALDIPWDSPVYTIGESASYSRLGALEDRIDSIKLNGSSYFSGKVSSSTSGTNVYLIKKDDETDPSDTNAYSSLRTDKEIKEGIEKNNNELGKKFLSKLKDDTASGIITFLRGLIIGNFSSGESGGQISDDGAAELASLLLRGALEIGKYSAGKSGAKIGEDGAAELLSVLVRGLVTAQGIQSPGFSTGALGTGLCLKMDENGDSYIEVDRMLVRKVAEFIQLVIQEIKHVGGQIVLTPASMKCIRVEDTGSAYRCYFEATDGEKTVENQFVAGDQARAQTFNVKEGVNENVKNTYYWRLVTGVGDNYIDLSKTDCDAGSTVPAAGDEIVQLGNRNDVARQAAIILSAYGNDAPYFKMYRGINSYKLEGKEFVNLSRKDVMIISDNIKLSTGETVKEYINGAVGDVQSKVDEVSGKVEDAVERLAEQQNYIAALQKTAGDLQNQIDGAIESYFEKTDPTTSNYPANEWTTEEQKQAHSNDTYTNLSTGKSWKWVKDGDTWKWNAITDTATEKALAAAAKAQDTADGKRRVFVSQPTTGQAYDVGDLWVNATYGDTYKNDLLRCKTAKKENEAFSISHWELASRYTDDTKANEAAEAAREAAEAANAAQEAADEAAATAGEAKTEAQAANTELDNLKSDGTISPVEKTALKQQHADIKAEHGQITAEAGKYSISVTDYEAAYKKADSALTKYTASTPEYITVESDYSDISAYYSKRQTILDTIAAKAKEASDAAKKAADDAAEAAKNAQADATNANKELANIKSDNLISPIEKTALKQQQADIRSEYGEITANAARYAVSTTAYKSAYDLANAALTKYTASSPEYITVGSDYANISAYYDARKTILDAIAAGAKKAADDATNKANQAVEDAARAGHYYLDLDNDGGPVSCDASGNVTGGFPSSKATVYYGTEPDTGWAFTGAFSGCSGSVNSSTGQITVTGVSADTGTVTVTAKKSGKTDLSAVFSVYKVKAGADGADGTNGVGIKSITNKYAVSASNTTAPTSWSDTVPTMTTTNRYLWNYEIVTYTNSTTSETKKRVIGAYGNTGNTGATGATGVGIKSITEYYLASSASSGVTTSTSGWTTSVQSTSSSKKYLWNYEVVTYTNDTKYTSSPVIIGTYGDKGDTGPQGVQGPKGADGTPRYTWIRYADNASGSGISNSPTGKTYIGFAYNKTTATESNTPSDYTWSLIKGEKGDQGVPGAKGADGKTTYTWIKYSDNSTGSGMYDTPKSTTQYIGIAVNKTTATESNTPSDYTWSKFKGDDGADGKGIKSTAVTYQVSTSGTTPPTGTWNSSIPSVAANQYLWTRTVITYTDNTTSTSYSVGKMGANGAKGDKGDTGPAGADGDGIVSVSNTYQIGSSGTTAPTGSWSATVPSPQKGKYLWTKTVTTYKKSDPTTVYSVSYYGTDGTAAKYVRVAGDQVFIYTNNFSGNPTPTSITLTATLTGTSGYQWSYKQAGQTSFTNISGATSQTYALAHNNSTVWGSAKSVTIRCTSGGVYDEMTIAKVSSGTNGTNGKDGTNGTNGKDGAAGKNGADAYTIILGNESHAFQGTTSAAIAASTKCEVIAYKGATRVAATIGTITGAPSGMSTSISSNGTTSASFTVSVTSSLTTGQGVLTVPITVDGKSFTKNFSFSVAFKGNTGATGATGPKGDAAVFYTIEPSANVVKKSWDNKLTPTSVTCTKYKQTGSNARATTTEKTLKYQRVGTDSSVQTAASGSSVTVSPTSTTTSIKFWLYDGSNIIMMQEVPVVGDAVDVYTKVHAEITAAEGEIGLLSTKVTTVTDSVTGLEKEVETNTAEIKSAKGQISSTASQVSSLGTRVSTVEQTASGLTTTVNGLNGKVSKLEQTDSSLTSRITSAEGKVSTIEQKVSSISLKVDGIEPVNLFRDGSFESGYNTFRTSGSGKDDVEVGISANGKVGKNAMMVKWPGKRTTVYLEQNPFVNPNATYTVSFWMYTNVATNYQVFVINALDKNDNNLSVNDSTLNIEIPGTKWTQFIHRFTTPANTERLEFYFRASTNVENGTISYIDGFMLLKGDYLDNIPSYFIPNDSVNGETLLSTGIDIENKKVIVTSDQFVIKNNDGEVTASVNEDGVLSVGSGEFSGFIRTIPRIITKNTGDNGDVEFKDNYYQISLSNLYKGGFIYVDVESNSYAGDGIKLPLGLKYAGARVTIVNKYPAKRLIITTRHEALDPGYGDWSDDENNAMRLGGVQISHVEMGNVSTQGNNRFVELLAVPYYLDETIGSVKYQGQVEWVVLNNQEFTTANNTTGVKYAKFK